MRYPDLICLGAQKAATTWLDARLRQDPRIFLPPVKEIHYFSSLYNRDARGYGPVHRKDQARSVIDWVDGLEAPDPAQLDRKAQAQHLARDAVDDAWYGRIFAPARPDQICAEVCPSYMNIPEAGVEHALRLNPEVRLLVLVRDPVDRAWSHIRMHMKRGIETREAEKFVTGEASLWAYLFYTDYAAALPRWQARVRPDRLRLILHDQVAVEPRAVLDEIYSFAGLTVPPDIALPADPVHSGEKIEMPAALRQKLLDALAPQYAYLETLFPEAAAGWLARHRAGLARAS